MAAISAENGQAIKSEAFLWWLDQDKEGRKGKHLVARFGISSRVADRWRSEFNSTLAERVGQAVEVRLKAYVDEYEKVQGLAASASVVLMEAYTQKLEVIKEALAEGVGEFDHKTLAEIASGVKTVYQLAEVSTGADVAKKRATAQSSPCSGAAPALPSMAGVFEALSIASDESESDQSTEKEGVSNDSANESAPSSAEGF